MERLHAIIAVCTGMLCAACNSGPPSGETPETLPHGDTAREETEVMTLETAAESAKKALRDLGYEVDKMRMAADESNSRWERYVAGTPGILESPLVRDMKLGDKRYWVLYFRPVEKRKGGDAWVFVDRDTGEIIGLIRGK